MDANALQPIVLTAEQAAHVLLLDQDRTIELAVRALYRLVDTGKLKPAIVGKRRRFTMKEIERYLDEQVENYSD